jgi:hypothetical protein
MLGILTLSFVLHAPWGVPNFYSDVVAFFAREWVRVGQLPYVSAFFEYPPVCGFIVFASSHVGETLLDYYNTIGILVALAGVGVIWSTWSISKLSGARLKPAFFLAPSLLLFGVYNFDIFHVLFIMVSLQQLLLRRNAISAVATGLGILTKLTNVVLLPIFLFELRGTRERMKYLSITLLVIVAVNLPLVYLNFSTWFQTYTYLRGYGLENAWFLWIFWNPATWDYAKYFGFVIAGFLLLRAYTLRTDLLTKAFLAIAAYLLGTYIYTPQLNIILIPLAAILLLDHPSFYIWEVSNALIILLWFVVPDPLALGSAPQLMATLRAAALAWLSLTLLRRKRIYARELLPGFLLRPITQLKDEFAGRAQVIVHSHHDTE